MPMSTSIPFYHEVAHGLYWAPDRLTWVTLRRAGSQVRVTGQWRVPVRNGDVAPALDRLVDRVAPTDRTVATHVDPSLVRCTVETVDPYADVDEWTRDQVARMLPPNVSPDAFVARTQRLPATATPDAAPRMVIALTRRGAVEARCDQLDAAGLTPLVVGDVRLGLGLAFAYDSRFTPGDAEVVFGHGDRAWRLPHRDGRLSGSPDGLAGSGRDALDDVLVTQGDADVFAAGTVSRFGDDAGRTRDVRWAARVGDDAVETVSIPAAACAMATLYPDAGTVNFLDAADVAHRRDERDRGEAQRVMLAVSVVVGVFLLAATVATSVVSGWTQSADAELARLDGRPQRVEQAEQTRTALRSRLRRSRTLVHRRTHTAALLERVGHSVPEAAWLDGIEVTRPAGNASAEDRSPRDAADDLSTSPRTASVRVTGFATRDAAVAALLGALERKDGLQSIRLTASERLTGEAVTRQTGLRRDALHRFDVRLRYRSTP